MGSEHSKVELSKSESKKSVSNKRTQSIDNIKRQNNNNLSLSSKVAPSSSCNDNLLKVEDLSKRSSRLRSSSAASVLNQKPITFITLKNKQLIMSCFQNPHENIGKRILKRTAEKRSDFAQFYWAATIEQREDIEENMKTFLKNSVANIEFVDEMQKVASDFGEHLVQYRAIGFKTDFFSTIGDAIITECIFLDNAVHQTHQTLNAFSLIITMLLSSVRDGFYKELKRLRRTSNSLSIISNCSNNGMKKSLASRESSSQSISLGVESLRNSTNSINNKENNNILQTNDFDESLKPKTSLKVDENLEFLFSNKESSENTKIINQYEKEPSTT